MIQHQGIYLPAGETHLTEWMTKSGEIVDGVGTYQIKKLRAAMGWCKQYRTAIDVGGHVGMWSMQLAKAFHLVHAFEPVAAHRACFELNLADRLIVQGEVPPNAEHNVALHAYALGERDDVVAIHTAPTSSGDSWVDPDASDESKTIPMRRLDDMPIEEVDFVKLDCEGYELFALRGMEQILQRCHPCVIVEQKPGRATKFGLKETEAVDYLRSLGAHLRGAISGDYILSWD